MNRVWDELKLATVGGLSAAALGASISWYMHASHHHHVDYYPRPNDYTPMTATSEGAQQLRDLAAKLDGKQVNVPSFPEIRTREYIRFGDCDVPGGTPLHHLMLKSRNGTVMAAADPPDFCGDQRRGLYNRMAFEVPLWALPMELLAKQYGAESTDVALSEKILRSNLARNPPVPM